MQGLASSTRISTDSNVVLAILDEIPDFGKKFHIANDASVIHVPFVVNRVHCLYVVHHGHSTTTKVQWFLVDRLAAHLHKTQ